MKETIEKLKVLKQNEKYFVNLCLELKMHHYDGHFISFNSNFSKNDKERFFKAYKEVKEKYKLSRTDIGWFIDDLNFNLF